MLRLSGEKMAKSLGNIDLLADALDRWGAETFLMFLLQAHYASPIDYDDGALESARSACTTLRNRLRAGSGTDEGLRDSVIAALDEDFNTPEALARLFTAPAEARDTVAEVLDVLGLGGLAHDEPPPPDVVALAEGRREARARRDFAESDRIREELAGRGWEVRDAGNGYELYPRDG
jgi:cysteinyl-tRNA synthetase